MKIRISDITHEGCPAEFELDREAVTRRASLADSPELETSPTKKGSTPHVDAPGYRFPENPQVRFDLTSDGGTVLLRGQVTGRFVSSCARCAEATKQELDVPVDMVLKPDTQKSEDEPEDVNFGYYHGEEIDCGAVAEEALMLSLPFVVICREECRGLCPSCGANLNLGDCGCEKDKGFESPFSILKDMKILQ